MSWSVLQLGYSMVYPDCLLTKRPFLLFTNTSRIITTLIDASILLKNKSSSCHCDAEDCESLGVKKLSKSWCPSIFIGVVEGFCSVPATARASPVLANFHGSDWQLCLGSFVRFRTNIIACTAIGRSNWLALNQAPLFRKWISVFGGGIIATGAGTMPNKTIETY